jgi:hypothetical protein
VRADIKFIQLSQTPAIFTAGCQFFLKKWKKDPDSDVLLVVNYIENECFEPKSMSNWYEGYNSPNNMCSVSTNNGNEAVNRCVETLRRENNDVMLVKNALFCHSLEKLRQF